MNKQIKYVDYFTTKDQQLSSLLYATGQTLDSSYWENGACFFVFENKIKCEAIVADYYKGLIKINAKAIFDALQTIKGIIHSR